TYEYAPVPPPMLHRALRMQDVCARHGVPLRAAAVRFALAHPAVTGALIGARDAGEITDAAAWLARPVPPALWQDLRSEGLLPDTVPVPGEDDT
ncbi:aldo/keto reductase, partial [Streptomyces sp. t39]|uniref:aldo/keto reductase n=1 Tax=Streptomyces sp. t39 TaxID=1828156 RepID=UPI0012CFCFC4